MNLFDIFFQTLPAQILGFLAMIIDIRASCQKKDITLKKMHALASLIFSIHFLMLTAWVGALSELLNGLRTYISIKDTQKKIGIFFCFLYLFLLITITSTAIETLPFIASISITFGLYFCKGQNLRIMYLFGWVLWFIYSFYVGSFGGTVLFFILCITTSHTIFKLSKQP